MKQSIIGMIKKIQQYLKRVAAQQDPSIQERNVFLEFRPPGHFYSPIPSMDEIMRNEKKIWGELPLTIAGVDLNTNEQLDLLRQMERYYHEIPFEAEKKQGLRYYFNNSAYSYSDAIFLYCMIRHTQPQRIIEVGSGYSSCVMLDTSELYFNGNIQCSFIEPYPELLKSLINNSDESSITIHESPVQDVPIDTFKSLRSNDILFIDSTHVSKIHSDVNYIIHEILPALHHGVYIHFHDISYPFEYSKEWVMEGRAWNEQYVLRAFLEYNSQFKIVLFNTYVESLYADKMINTFPLAFKNTGGSIWLRKI